MRTVNIHEAKTQLSRLLAAVEAGDEVLISRAGKPIARLVGLQPTPRRRPLGLLEGKFAVPVDFDAPLPDDIQTLFEGR